MILRLNLLPPSKEWYKHIIASFLRLVVFGDLGLAEDLVQVVLRSQALEVVWIYLLGQDIVNLAVHVDSVHWNSFALCLALGSKLR